METMATLSARPTIMWDSARGLYRGSIWIGNWLYSADAETSDGCVQSLAVAVQVDQGAFVQFELNSPAMICEEE